MKNYIFLFLLIAVSFTTFAQDKKVKWYSIEDVDRLIKESPRPVFIDTYTDWCGWCKKLDSDTFTNPVIAEILNGKFYPVKFDAEGKNPVTFQGKVFINDGKNGNSHQLGIALLRGNLSYPTVVFLNEAGQLIAPVPGYRDPKQLEQLLSYFLDKGYEKLPFEEYIKTFKGRVK